MQPRRAGLPRPPSRRVPTGVHVVQSVADLAHQLVSHPQDIGGFRALMTGSTDQIDAGGEAIDLVKAMADAGADVILVDWSPEGHGIAERIGADPRAGLNELLQGQAKFEDVVTRIPASGAHFIPAGTAVLDRDMLLDPDQLNLTLDALDTAYDHIVVVARSDVARALFEAILGRFDAGIIVSEPKRRATAGRARHLPRLRGRRHRAVPPRASQIEPVGARAACASDVKGRRRGARRLMHDAGASRLMGR